MINIIIAGGTLCKHYNPHTGEMTSWCKSSISEAFMMLNPPVFAANSDKPAGRDYKIHVWKYMDSANMKHEDVQSLYEFASKFEDILVIHGTDTIATTAKYFKEQDALQKRTRRAVFTGAFIPMSLRMTDSEMNLGFAYACAKTLKDGVYVAMNGQIFDPDKVRKNERELRFENDPSST